MASANNKYRMNIINGIKWKQWRKIMKYKPNTNILISDFSQTHKNTNKTKHSEENRTDIYLQQTE